ncbi:MAG: hypothetical protein NWE96_10190 [Candidatus Bathyarchaeota archaeon]|nr:hypothetical protein [Candidatus Bathyarchaeota archaeon]
MAELYDYAPMGTTTDLLNPMAPTVDPILMELKDFAINAIELFAAFMLTYLYFINSDKKPSAALKWGVAYSAPVSLITLIFWLSNISSSNVIQSVVGDILYLPATFFWGLLSAGGFYLFWVYRPKLNFVLLSYIILLVFYIVFSLAVYGLGAGLTWAFTDAVIAVSMAGLFYAVKNYISFPFPPLLLYGEIGLGFMIIYWISDFVYLDFVPYYVEFLAFVVTGLVLHFLMKMNIMGIGDSLPPPPPPPEPTVQN